MKNHYFSIIFNIFSSLPRLWSSPTVVGWPRWIFCSIQIVYMNQRDSFPASLSSKTYRDRSDEITKNFDFFFEKIRIVFFPTFSLKSLVKLIFRLFRLFSIFSIFPRIFDFAKDFFEKISSRIFFGLKKNSFHFFFQDHPTSSHLDGFWIGQKFWKALNLLFRLSTTFPGVWASLLCEKLDYCVWSSNPK